MNSLQRLFQYLNPPRENPYYSENTHTNPLSQEERAFQLKSQQITQSIYDLIDFNQESILKIIQERRECCRPFNERTKRNITQRFLPTFTNTLFRSDGLFRFFCGKFSSDGSTFLSGSNDRKIRLFDCDTYNLSKLIQTRNIQWAIIDSDFSPDGRWISYSSWSSSINLVSRTSEDYHESLDVSNFQPDLYQVCFFSIKFSSDSREILAGNNLGKLVLYNLDRRQSISQVEGHQSDINTVGFIDDSSQVYVSGSDDFLIKVWDRRTQNSVGTLVGHLEGVTHIQPKGDGVYLISNGKDQCIKLWDIRKMVTPNRDVSGFPDWDYRYGWNTLQGYHRRVFSGMSVHKQDSSLMSYRGHEVFQTLIRCYFSPVHTTAQKYIYTGSSNGSVFIYDVLTGEIVRELKIHQAVVRDVAWHPYKSELLSSSWDRTIKISTPFQDQFKLIEEKQNRNINRDRDREEEFEEID